MVQESEIYFDMGQLDDIDRHSLQVILNMSLHEGDRIISELKKYLANSETCDLCKVKQFIHTLKGLMLSIGCKAIAAKCRLVERVDPHGVMSFYTSVSNIIDLWEPTKLAIISNSSCEEPIPNH